MIRFALPLVVTQMLISWRIQNIIGFAAEAHGVSEKPVHLKFCNVWVRVQSFNVVNGDGGHIHIHISPCRSPGEGTVSSPILSPPS